MCGGEPPRHDLLFFSTKIALQAGKGWGVVLLSITQRINFVNLLGIEFKNLLKFLGVAFRKPIKVF